MVPTQQTRTICLLLLLAAGAFACQPSPKIYVRYQSSFDEIIVDGGRLTCRSFWHHYPQDQPFRATPDSITTTLVLDRVAIPGRRREELQKLLNDDFWQLPDTLGAPEGQRAYPSEIFVRKADASWKRVVYRSNPAYEKEPPAYSRIKNFLILIAQEQKNLLRP